MVSEMSSSPIDAYHLYPAGYRDAVIGFFAAGSVMRCWGGRPPSSSQCRRGGPRLSLCSDGCVRDTLVNFLSSPSSPSSPLFCLSLFSTSSPSASPASSPLPPLSLLAPSPPLHCAAVLHATLLSVQYKPCKPTHRLCVRIAASSDGGGSRWMRFVQRARSARNAECDNCAGEQSVGLCVATSLCPQPRPLHRSASSSRLIVSALSSPQRLTLPSHPLTHFSPSSTAFPRLGRRRSLTFRRPFPLRLLSHFFPFLPAFCLHHGWRQRLQERCQAREESGQAGQGRQEDLSEGRAQEPARQPSYTPSPPSLPLAPSTAPVSPLPPFPLPSHLSPCRCASASVASPRFPTRPASRSCVRTATTSTRSSSSSRRSPTTVRRRRRRSERGAGVVEQGSGGSREERGERRGCIACLFIALPASTPRLYYTDTCTAHTPSLLPHLVMRAAQPWRRM